MYSSLLITFYQCAMVPTLVESSKFFCVLIVLVYITDYEGLPILTKKYWSETSLTIPSWHFGSIS